MSTNYGIFSSSGDGLRLLRNMLAHSTIANRYRFTDIYSYIIGSMIGATKNEKDFIGYGIPQVGSFSVTDSVSQSGTEIETSLTITNLGGYSDVQPVIQYWKTANKDTGPYNVFNYFSTVGTG